MTFKNGFILQTYGIEDLQNSFFVFFISHRKLKKAALIYTFCFGFGAQVSKQVYKTSNALPSSKTTAAASAKSIELLCHTTIKSNFA